MLRFPCRQIVRNQSIPPSMLNSIDGGICTINYCMQTATAFAATWIPKEWLHLIEFTHCLADNFLLSSFNSEINFWQTPPPALILADSARISENLNSVTGSLIHTGRLSLTTSQHLACVYGGQASFCWISMLESQCRWSVCWGHPPVKTQ